MGILKVKGKQTVQVEMMKFQKEELIEKQMLPSEMNIDRALANDITQMIESWEPPSPRLCRNYRVPHAIHRGNEEAYTPDIISIGPFHHGDKRLKPMEELKVKYFTILVKESALDVENSLSTIRIMEKDIRRCYEEPSMLSSDDYVKMI